MGNRNWPRDANSARTVVRGKVDEAERFRQRRLWRDSLGGVDRHGEWHTCTGTLRSKRALRLAVEHSHQRGQVGFVIEADAGDLDASARAGRAVSAMLAVLGLDAAEPAGSDGTDAALDALVREMIAQRARARADKDWAAADRIRDAIAAAGITLEDTPAGTNWSIDA